MAAPPFAPIYEAARSRLGAAALEARLTKPRSPAELKAVTDDRYLSQMELRIFRVDKTVLETGAKDPELHLRQIAVVRHRLELGWRAGLRQARFERRGAEASARRLVDRCERRCGHRSLRSSHALRTP